MTSWLASAATYNITMTNTEVNNMDGSDRGNSSRGLPRYNREKYMYSTDPNLVHPHMQENVALLPDLVQSPSPKSDPMCNYNNGHMVR